MKRRVNEDIATRSMLDTIHEAMEYKPSMNDGKRMLNEESEMVGDGIAITDDPKFGEKVLTNQIEQFMTEVDSGAQFSTANSENPSASPLIYMPSTGNLVFSGVIPKMNNLKWQFVLKNNTGNGCFIWSDGMILNQENMKTLAKLQGFYMNWQEQWNRESKNFEIMAKNANR